MSETIVILKVDPNGLIFEDKSAEKISISPTLKVETLPDLDDLLQCPVCYEIPAGQIFQCNEGHHVCGRCKLRLDVCPVCRAFFFGTRNYAMEELISNIRKLRAFKLGGKVTTGNTTPEQQSVEARESTSEDNNSTNDDDDSSVTNRILEAPRPCSGLFRCLCCKTNPERLPSARLLNHLRYFHSPQLIEGRSDENGEYLQAWQFCTKQGRIVTAVRVGEMGLFFLVIEIIRDSVFAWLAMAASPVVAEEFSYTFTLSGNDREAIFSDCVWSVRTCEGYLKKRSRCLSVTGADARALLLPSTMSAKLALRRTSPDALQQAQPRAVLRVANRSNRSALGGSASEALEPFLQYLQNDVVRLSRAFATLGREANALVRSETEMRARIAAQSTNRGYLAAMGSSRRTVAPPAPLEVALPPPPEPEVEVEPAPEGAALSRNARRRMRQRLRKALRETQMDNDAPLPPLAASQPTPSTAGRQTDSIQNNSRVHNAAGSATNQNSSTASANNSNQAITNQSETARASLRASSPVHTVFSGPAVLVEPPQPAPPALPPTAANGNGGRNKKKRRQRR